MYSVNWQEIEEEGIRPITKTKRKHHYHIREGSALEGICFALCLIGTIGILIMLGL